MTIINEFETDVGGSLGEDNAVREDGADLVRGPKAQVSYIRVESPLGSNDSAEEDWVQGPAVNVNIPQVDISMFSPAEVRAIRGLASVVITEEITGKWPSAKYRRSVSDYKRRVRALEKNLKDAEERIAHYHKFAGDKYKKLSEAFGVLDAEGLPKRVANLEQYKELIETKYSGVPEDVGRDIWNSGFEAALKAIIDRGFFNYRLTEDSTFMELVRDKEALFRAIDAEKAQRRLQRNRAAWTERNSQRRGGILPGKHVPASQHAAREDEAARSTYRNRCEQIAAEREAEIMKMAEEQERDEKDSATGGTLRAGAPVRSGTSGAPRSTAAPTGSLKEKVAEVPRPPGEVPKAGPSAASKALVTEASSVDERTTGAVKRDGGSGRSADATTPEATGALERGGSGFVSAVMDPMATSLASGPKMRVVPQQAGSPRRARRQLSSKKK